MDFTAEGQRLAAADEQGVPWRWWGPYLSDRQWGTVREDYSRSGDAWSYFTHDQARSRAYRWGEDGIAGVSDDQQHRCLSLALWNHADPILKERFFGLTNAEGNHGEDVKEYYFHLDSTPTHSYMRMLYKYPQAAYPYEDLVLTNRARSRQELEYELLDTGVFAGDRYFDVEVEYAKADPEDLIAVVTVTNRGPADAPLDVLASVWFRNTWTWAATPGGERPALADGGPGKILISHPQLGQWVLWVDPGAECLFTENETNAARLFGGQNHTPYVKDGIDEYVVHGRAGAVNPARTGTKAAARHRLMVPAGGSATVRWRLRRAGAAAPPGGELGPGTGAMVARSRAEADEFYQAITPPGADAEGAMIMRRALAGMLWSKQFYYFDLDRWLQEHEAHPLRNPKHEDVRNRHWFHMQNGNILSMPDCWEYPWYAAWDLAFHCVPLSMVDPALTRQQIELILSDVYLQPSGQIPASRAWPPAPGRTTTATPTCWAARPTRRCPGWTAGTCSRSWMSGSCAGSCPACSTRSASSARTGSGPCRAAIGTSRSCLRCTGRSTGCSTCPPSPTPPCSAATPTGAARSGSPSTCSSSGRC